MPTTCNLSPRLTFKDSYKNLAPRSKKISATVTNFLQSFNKIPKLLSMCQAKLKNDVTF